MTRILLFMTGLVMASAAPNPNPGLFSNGISEQVADLMDKIPSVEVKVGSDGVAVSTGPSNSDLYYMLGLIIGSIAIFIAIMALLVWCCFSNNRSRFNNRLNPVAYGSKLQNMNPLTLASSRLNAAKIQVGIHL